MKYEGKVSKIKIVEIKNPNAKHYGKEMMFLTLNKIEFSVFPDELSEFEDVAEKDHIIIEFIKSQYQGNVKYIAKHLVNVMRPVVADESVFVEV